MIPLLDPPLRLPDRLRLLADDLLAESPVVGERRGHVTHAGILMARLYPNRAKIRTFQHGTLLTRRGLFPGTRPNRKRKSLVESRGVLKLWSVLVGILRR